MYDVLMARTTVTLVPEAEAAIRKLMSERGISFKQAINSAILDGVPPAKKPKPFKQRTYKLGMKVPLDHATTLLGELEDIELIRKRDLGK